MSSAHVAYHRPRPRSRLDQASLVLLQAIRVDDWRADAAGRQLLARVHGDRRVLELLRARVARAMLTRPTRTDLRAAATLESAMGLLRAPEPARAPRVPAQRGGGADG
jgi:hypothetical protein